MTTVARGRGQPPGSFLDQLDDSIRSLNATSAPLVAFLVAVVAVGVAAFVALSNWLAAWWGIDPAWQIYGRLALAFAAIPAVAALFGVANIFLTLVGCQAINVRVPVPQWDWSRPQRGLPFVLGMVAVAIGATISRTIFT